MFILSFRYNFFNTFLLPQLFEIDPCSRNLIYLNSSTKKKFFNLCPMQLPNVHKHFKKRVSKMETHTKMKFMFFVRMRHNMRLAINWRSLKVDAGKTWERGTDKERKKDVGGDEFISSLRLIGACGLWWTNATHKVTQKKHELKA
jgi:hypothetical protein